jgi:hypothetical protein
LKPSGASPVKEIAVVDPGDISGLAFAALALSTASLAAVVRRAAR